MTKNENFLFGIVGSIFHELRQSILFVLSAYSVLDNKVPETVVSPLEEFGNISKKLLTEIEAQFGNLFRDIDSHSLATVSAQLRLLAIEFEMDTQTLSLLIHKIKTLNIHLEDPAFDKVLNETLSFSLQNFINIVDYLKNIQAKDLTTKYF